MLRADDPHFQQFGEIYFATVYCGVVKGWHLHHEMTLNLACIYGRLKVVCYDDRPGSPTTHPHDRSRSERLDPFDNHIPYDWGVRHG